MEERIVEIILQHITGGSLVAFYIAWSLVRLVFKPLFDFRKELGDLVKSTTRALNEGVLGHAEIVEELKAINAYLQKS